MEKKGLSIIIKYFKDKMQIAGKNRILSEDDIGRLSELLDVFSIEECKMIMDDYFANYCDERPSPASMIKKIDDIIFARTKETKDSKKKEAIKLLSRLIDLFCLSKGIQPIRKKYWDGYLPVIISALEVYESEELFKLVEYIVMSTNYPDKNFYSIFQANTLKKFYEDLQTKRQS